MVTRVLTTMSKAMFSKALADVAGVTNIESRVTGLEDVDPR